MCPGGGVFFEKSAFFWGLARKRQKPCPEAGFRQTKIYAKKSKKHEKTAKF
jgi:hypothetical protein